MKSKKLRTVIATFIMLAMLVFTMSPVATALLSDKKGSITLHVVDSTTKEPLIGTTFRLYHVADAYQSGTGIQYKFRSPYEKAGIDLGNLQDSYLPVHLAYFSVMRNLPHTEEKADKSGLVVFNDLTPGLYLIVPWGNFGNHFTPPPFVINIPQYDHEGENWDYDIVATPKLLTNEGYNDGTTYISVQKKWDTTQKHPKNVTVVLLKNMEEYDKVVLNEKNNWYHRWDSLEKGHFWNVVEINVPDGYTVTYETSSNTVTVINTYDGDEGDEDETTTQPGGNGGTTTPGGNGGTTTPGGNGGTTTPGGNGGATTPGGNGGATTPGGNGGTTTPGGNGGTTGPSGDNGDGETTKKDELISTGQLNWPVPIMAISGLLIFGIGWAMLNLGKKEADE